MPSNAAALPQNEARRLEALHRLEILDTLPEQAYDDLTVLASQVCGTPIALVALIDAGRQWYKSTIGTTLRQTERNVAFCAHAILQPDEVFTVEDASLDPRFTANPLVVGEPHVRFYAGAPIVMASGEAVGTMCVIDTRPRTLSDTERRCLQALARQASMLLDLRDKALASERLAREHEQMSVEARLKQKSGLELLDLVLRGGRMGLWDLHVPSGVWTVNAREQAMLGYAGVVAPDRLDWRALVHPDDRPALDAAMKQHLEGRTSFYECTHRMRHAEGHYLWLLDRGVVVERDVRGDAIRIVGTHVDITAQKHGEDEQRRAGLRCTESEARMRGIIDNMPALIAELDTQGCFRFANETYRTWLGVDPASIVGKPAAEAISDAYYEGRRDFIARALRGEDIRFDQCVDLPAGRRFLQTTYLPHVTELGCVAGVYALTSDITELKATQEKLDTLARVDPLTGLANRRQFEEKLAEAMARTRRTGIALAVLYIDIDHFKSINDGYGHAAGDAVLVAVGERLRHAVREIDLVARHAGDEFVVVLEGIADLSEAPAVATKLVDAMRPPFEILGHVLEVTTSVGVAVFDGGVQEIPALLLQADRALYAAKAEGRDRAVLSNRPAPASATGT